MSCVFNTISGNWRLSVDPATGELVGWDAFVNGLGLSRRLAKWWRSPGWCSELLTGWGGQSVIDIYFYALNACGPDIWRIGSHINHDGPLNLLLKFCTRTIAIGVEAWTMQHSVRGYAALDPEELKIMRGKSKKTSNGFGHHCHLHQEQQSPRWIFEHGGQNTYTFW